MSEIFAAIDKDLKGNYFRMVPEKCLDCIHECLPEKVNLSKVCLDFEKKIRGDEIKELNYEIKRQNVDLRKMCKGYRIGNRIIKLNLRTLKKMLAMKQEFTYKYLFILNHRLSEAGWVDEFLNNHSSGFNESNTFYEAQFIKDEENK